MSDKSKEPSMSDLARMIEALDDKLDNKVESVKSDLTKSINDQADHFKKTLKNTIDEVVEPIGKRQDEYEDKSDQRFARLEASVANLTDLITQPKAANHLPHTLSCEEPHAFPPLPPPAGSVRPPTSPFLRPPPTTPGQGPPNTSDTIGTNSAITELIAEARTVIGIGPIDKSDIDYFGQGDSEKGIRLAAIEALREELNIKEYEIADPDIASTFLPKGAPRIPRVYIKFHKLEHANLCLKLAKTLQNPDIKVFRYFPRQFQDRVRALEDVAYPLRKTSNPPYKTEVVYTDSDVQLLVCPKGQARYYPYYVSDLPPFDMTPTRSPPPGRQRHDRHNKRNRSDSSSPDISRKSVRQISPMKPASVNDLDSSVSVHPTTAAALKENVQTEPSSHPPTLPLPIVNPALDLGDFIDNQVVSPMTGKVRFNFDQPINKRRQSLNL